MKKVVLADDFRNAHRPLTIEERDRLEQLMRLSPETVPPLIVSKLTKGPPTLIDGYNRYALWTKIGGKPKYVEQEFPDRDVALAFAKAVPFAGRTPTPSERAEALKSFSIETLQRLAGHVPSPKGGSQVAPPNGESKKRKAEALAAAAKCSKTTARRVLEEKEPEPERDDPPPSGKQKHDPRPWELWDDLFGKLKRATDALHKERHSVQNRDLMHAGLNAAFEVFKKWRKS